MIQELLSGGSATNSTRLLGERTISNSLFTSNTCPSSSPILNNSNNITSIATSTLPYTTSAVPNSANSAGGASENNSNNNNNNSNSNSNNLETNNNNNSNSNSSQNLRCPRCDSTNTKFCYYNNYNLTQPRHFCKTCRRYWTKGGTLRNVPIGGGCRKNKSTISTSSSPSSMSSKSSNHHPNNNFLAKCSKTAFASDMLVNDHNSLFLGNGLLDNPFHTPGPNPLLWSSSPPQSQNTSHILALLRGSNNPFSNPNNPNPNPNPNSGSSVFTTLGLDSYSSNGAPSSLLGSFTRTTNQQTHLINGFGPDFVENNHGSSNIMDLYQRLKSSSSPTNNYGYNCSNTENSSSTILGHMVGSSTTNSSSSSSTMMNSNAFETTSLGGGGGGDHLGGYGFMMSASPAFSSWSEFPAVPINGAYP